MNTRAVAIRASLRSPLPLLVFITAVLSAPDIIPHKSASAATRPTDRPTDRGLINFRVQQTPSLLSSSFCCPSFFKGSRCWIILSLFLGAINFVGVPASISALHLNDEFGTYRVLSMTFLLVHLASISHKEIISNSNSFVRNFSERKPRPRLRR